jgi:hypothetical protein
MLFSRYGEQIASVPNGSHLGDDIIMRGEVRAAIRTAINALAIQVRFEHTPHGQSRSSSSV